MMICSIVSGSERTKSRRLEIENAGVRGGVRMGHCKRLTGGLGEGGRDDVFQRAPGLAFFDFLFTFHYINN